MKKMTSIFMLVIILTLLLTPAVWAAPTTAPYAQGGGNIFDTALEKITDLARDAWVFLTSLIVIVAVLGGLYYALQGTAGAAFGGSRLASTAIIGLVGLIILALVVFLVLPSLAEVLKGAIPQAPF